MHMAVQGSTGVKISQVQITAPGDSPNTDGIHIQGCTQVEISNSVIQTGNWFSPITLYCSPASVNVAYFDFVMFCSNDRR